MATDRESLNNYYDLLEDTLKGNGIFNSPSHIFIPLSPPSPKVLHENGAKILATLLEELKHK